jgi:uncharacterized membrane protein YqaE (UPF0057 family)
MKITKLAFVGMSISLILASCTIEKRVANRGYHIEWKGRYTTAKPAEKVSETKVAVADAGTLSTRPVNGELAEEKTLAASPIRTAQTAPTQQKESVVAVKTAEATRSAATSHEKSGKAHVVSMKEIKHAKKAQKSAKSQGSDVPVGVLYVLCFIVPFVAVGIVTDWDGKTVLYNILWTLLCGIPGIIHAIIVVNRES